MSDGVIDLSAERNRRAQPDPEFVKQDDFGRPMYLYLLRYEMDASLWQTDVWAYSEEDAGNRVKAMRESLELLGQAFNAIPA